MVRQLRRPEVDRTATSKAERIGAAGLLGARPDAAVGEQLPGGRDIKMLDAPGRRMRGGEPAAMLRGRAPSGGGHIVVARSPSWVSSSPACGSLAPELCAPARRRVVAPYGPPGQRRGGARRRRSCPDARRTGRVHGGVLALSVREVRVEPRPDPRAGTVLHCSGTSRVAQNRLRAARLRPSLKGSQAQGGVRAPRRRTF